MQYKVLKWKSFFLNLDAVQGEAEKRSHDVFNIRLASIASFNAEMRQIHGKTVTEDIYLSIQLFVFACLF
jgi:hypothetical protein